MTIIGRKIVSRKIENLRPDNFIKEVSLKDFYDKRNKILIIRSCGGLGDILMHRMIFEDFKISMPEAEIHFACPKYYHDALSDHPFIDKILDINDFDKNDYLISYNTSTACGRMEVKLSPSYGPHRSDIWANHCGLTLTKHNMHINLSESEINQAKKIIEENNIFGKSKVAICPVSSMRHKNLTEPVLVGLYQKLKENNFNPFCLNDCPINECYKNDIPLIEEKKIRIWMAILYLSDYVITVDTASLHLAGGLNKPTVGIFTFANGETYSKYYENTEIVQGGCPFNFNGCYNWGSCPEFNDSILLPCCKNLNFMQIFNKFTNLLERFPVSL